MNVALPERGSASRTSAVRSVPPGIRARVFLRSLTLQASWNRKGMQSLGVAFALWPALRWLYASRDDRVRAVRRHLAFFNTHPYLAAAILGGILRLEVRIAAGEESPEAVQRFKEALMFPFAAVGDSFFWLALRPFAGAVAALAFPWIGLWSVLVFLALYDVPHLALRVGMFRAGYRTGEGVVGTIGDLGLPGAGAILRRSLACLGGVAVVIAAWTMSLQPGVAWPGVAWPGLPPTGAILLPLGASVGTAAVGYGLLVGKGPVAAGYLAIVIGMAIALFLGT